MSADHPVSPPPPDAQGVDGAVPPPENIPPHDYAVIRSVGAMRRWEGRWWSWGRDGWKHVPHRDDPKETG